ncbi:MAG: transcription elongation factor GreB [Deltaproteobacteria bacterium]|nr:transcription elongation factor GreB [Deltaproteobacteria bacterium]
MAAVAQAGGRKVHITPEGAKKLQAELEQLWRVERPRVTREVAAAAALGDRSENAEYIYGKKRLREIDRRIEFLRKRFDLLEVVQPGLVARDRVYFGAWVTLEDESGTELCYRLVGPDESDVDRNLISVESPIGRALLGKSAGDEIAVERPAGRACYTLLEIRYESR